MSKGKRLYLSPPHMSGSELPFIREVFKSNWIAPLGPYVDAFEQAFARFNGVRCAAAVSSGTAALHLALRVLGIRRGDEVFCSSFTFCASATPILYEGGIPVFIDSDNGSWNMDPYILARELARCAKAGRLPKAVIVVHLYGQSADMDPIMACCAKYGVPVIEDAAEALGALYKNKKTGTRGYASVFSFNGNKIITTSGGGMLVSNDRRCAEKARFLATQARDPAPHYQHSTIGYNYRMSNVLAAIGLGQLRSIAGRIERKREVFETYRRYLDGIPGIEFMPEPSWSHSNRWLTCILVDPARFGATNDDVRRALESHNIEARPLWKPLHLQPVFKAYRICGGGVSDRLFARGLCLPSGTAMEDDDVQRVCKVIAGRYRRKSIAVRGKYATA